MSHGALQKLGGACDPEKQLSHLRFARLKFFHGSIERNAVSPSSEAIGVAGYECMVENASSSNLT
jgi:hypothetical protein